MKDYKKTSWVSDFNKLGEAKIPFVFLIDFEKQKPWHATLNEAKNLQVFFEFNGHGNNGLLQPSHVDKIRFEKFPLQYLDYLGQFTTVLQHLKYGNSFLINLTHRTPIETNVSLAQIYALSSAKYKMLFKDEFVFFSPEKFVCIVEDEISTYPMKGTIDAKLPNAVEKILRDEKELREHTTTVDLLRNDLSMVAKKVTVERFRYIDELTTNQKHLLQVSSEIKGKLPSGWQSKLGSILDLLTPAGSICGAPKEKTCDIIAKIEGVKRGYYTGICGYFDGVNLDAGVCIRYIERENDTLYFRSGCGITIGSKPQEEYQEMIDKIYLPIA